jgi:hypothetical protein
MDAEQLADTVNGLLDACYLSEDPFTTLNAELDRLRTTGEWSQLHLAQVRSMAIQTVKMIADSRSGA